MNDSLLLVFAHPDDESSSVASLAARYADQGIPVYLITVTDGSKGTRLGLAPEVSTATAREAELRRAVEIIGIRQLYPMGYADGGLAEADENEVTGKIEALMREISPSVVITFGPDGVTGHPDHRAVSRLASRAFDNTLRNEAADSRLYYVAIPESMLQSIGEIDGELFAIADEKVTATIDVSGWLEVKIQALKAHRSQADCRWLAELYRKNRQQPWARQEYLLRAYPQSNEKETALF